MGPRRGQGVLFKEQQGDFGGGTIRSRDDRREILKGGLGLQVLQGQDRAAEQELRIGGAQRQAHRELFGRTLRIIGLDPEEVGRRLWFGLQSHGRGLGG